MAILNLKRDDYLHKGVVTPLLNLKSIIWGIISEAQTSETHYRLKFNTQRMCRWMTRTWFLEKSAALCGGCRFTRITGLYMQLIRLFLSQANVLRVMFHTHTRTHAHARMHTQSWSETNSSWLILRFVRFEISSDQYQTITIHL